MIPAIIYVCYDDTGSTLTSTHFKSKNQLTISSLLLFVQTFLYISSEQQVIGCCVVEVITKVSIGGSYVSRYLGRLSHISMRHATNVNVYVQGTTLMVA